MVGEVEISGTNQPGNGCGVPRTKTGNQKRGLEKGGIIKDLQIYWDRNSKRQSCPVLVPDGFLLF